MYLYTEEELTAHLGAVQVGTPKETSSDFPVVNKQWSVEDVGASQLCASIQFAFSLPGTEMTNI